MFYLLHVVVISCIFFFIVCSVPPSADDLSTTSKKWSCPLGHVQKPKKRPTKDKDVDKVIRTKDTEEHKKRSASLTKNESKELIP